MLLTSGCTLPGAAKPTATPTPTRVAAAAPPARATDSSTATLTATATAIPATATLPVATSTASPTATRPSATPTATVLPATATPAGPTATPTPAPLVLRDWPAIPLREWPRPARDNGLGMHFLPKQYYDDAELQYGIDRLNELGVRWATVLYGDEKYLEKAALKFKAAGIMVVWRAPLRAYQQYYDWERDINVLRKVGMPPYFQVYNEPELAEEWDKRPIDRAQYLGNFVQAARDIYNAGGYVGLQFLDPGWMTDALNLLKQRKGEAIFGRMFFVAHPYGLNHPPEYQQGLHDVLSFLVFADLFKKQIGFVPPFIAGEGGWKYKATDDAQYPMVDEVRHRDYHLAVFNWFKTGKLSNGQPLPDYLLAFNVWILYGSDAAAWFDSFEGTRTLTINAVKAMSGFVRKYSWDY